MDYRKELFIEKYWASVDTASIAKATVSAVYDLVPDELKDDLMSIESLRGMKVEFSAYGKLTIGDSVLEFTI